MSFIGEIYKSAWRVCIWLGDSPETSLAGRIRFNLTPFWILAFTNRRISHTSPNFKDYLFRKTVVQLPRAIWTFGVQHLITALVASLHGTDPPWHTRLWVFQELNHAQRILWCFGPFAKSLGPQRFAEACRGARQCSRMKYDSSSSKLIDNFVNGLQAISEQTWWDDRVQYEEGVQPTLLTDTLLTQDLASKDASYRVYALRSVSRLEESFFIQPNYENSIAHVYAEAMYASIVGSGSFDIFRHVEVDATRSDHLPS